MRREGAVAALAFAGLAVAFFPEASSGAGAFFHYDTWLQNLTFRAWWFAQLGQGHFATWCPGMLSGFPLFAETQTGPLYPPTFLLFSTLPATVAFGWSVVLHFAFAGLGVYLLLRRLGAGRAGAAVAGVAFQFSGFLVTHVVHFNLLTGAAWMPWALRFALDAWRGNGRSAALLAGAVACLLLGAHPYATLQTLLLLGLALLVVSRGALAPLLGGGAVLTGAVCLGAAVAAVQVLPTADFLPQTARGDGVDRAFLTFGSFPPWSIAGLVNPDAGGTPVDGTFFAGRDWSHFAETAAYAGIGTLALAGAALVLVRGRLAGLFAGGLAASFVLMLGKFTPAYDLLSYLPLFRSTRLPGRFALPFTLCLAVLAGLGLDALLREASPARRRRALGVGALIVVALAGFAWVEGAPARAPDSALLATGRQWAGRVAEIAVAADHSAMRMVGFVGLALASLVPLALRKRPSAWAGWLPAGVLLVDLFAWGGSFNPVIDPAAIRAAPPVVSALPRTAPRPRVFRQGVAEYWERAAGMPRADLFTPGWDGHESEYATGAWGLPPNSQLLYGVDSGEGFTSLIPRQWLEWMGTPTAPGATPRPDLSEAQADLLALDAVISSGSPIAGEGWEPVETPGGLWVSRNRDPLPRVRLATSWTTRSREDVLQRVRSADHDPRTAVLLEAPPPGLPPESAGKGTDRPLAARETGPGRWEVEVPAGSGGMVVLAESWDPGWRVEDAAGDPVPAFRADGLFLAFPAPESGGGVSVRHLPRTLPWGAGISVVAALLLALLLARGFPGRLPGLPIPDDSASAPRGRWVALGVAALLVAASGAVDRGGWRAERAETSLEGAAVRSWAAEAHAAFRAGVLPQAAKLLDAALARRPDDASLRYRRGLVARSAGDEPVARAAFRAALALDPELTAARDALQQAPASGIQDR